MRVNFFVNSNHLIVSCSTLSPIKQHVLGTIGVSFNGWTCEFEDLLPPGLSLPNGTGRRSDIVVVVVVVLGGGAEVKPKSTVHYN
jgi:hypothetical protein